MEPSDDTNTPGGCPDMACRLSRLPTWLALRLAESYLTQRLFRQIVGPGGRLAAHST